MAWTVMARTCDDGDCPTFFVNSDTGAVRVRGYSPADPSVELDVEIPQQDWARLIAQTPR